MRPRKVAGGWGKKPVGPTRSKMYQRSEPEKWFQVRFAHAPDKRFNLKLGKNHNHGEDVMHCSCGYRKHIKK